MTEKCKPWWGIVLATPLIFLTQPGSGFCVLEMSSMLVLMLDVASLCCKSLLLPRYIGLSLEKAKSTQMEKLGSATVCVRVFKS